MDTTNKLRHAINPFIDWLIDNNKVEKSTLLFSYMETYLSIIKVEQQKIEKELKNNPELDKLIDETIN